MHSEQPYAAQPALLWQWRAMWRNNYDLLLLLMLVLVTPVLPLPLLRVPLGLVLVLFAPGYTLTAALFARRDDIDRFVRLAFSFGLSIVVIALLSLLLDRLPWGLRSVPIHLALSGWIVLTGAVAMLRRSLLPVAIAVVLPAPNLAGWWRLLRGPWRRRYVVGVLLGLAVLLSLGIAVRLAPSLTAPTTEFYILGAQGQAEAYPHRVVAGATVSVTLGIVNREALPRSYQVDVLVGQAGAESRPTQLARHGPFTVAPRQRLEQVMSWTMPDVGTDQFVDLVLLRADDPVPYRYLRLWLDVAAP